MARVDDRNNQARLLRRTQDEARTRENNLQKKHQTQVKRLNEQHTKTIRKMQENYETQINEVKDRSRDTLSDRDRVNQQKIEDLREMHRDQVRRTAVENERKVNQLNRANAAEKQKLGEISDRQKQSIISKHKAELDDVTRRFEKYSTETREEQHRSRVKQQEDMKNAQAKEIETILSNSDERLSRELAEKEKFKRTSDSEITRLKENLVNQRQDLSDQFLDTMKSENQSHQDRLSANRAAFQQEAAKLRAKYENVIAEEKIKSEISRENVAATAKRRQDNQLKALERKVREMEKGQVIQSQRMQDKFQTEKNNVIEDFNSRISDVENQKQAAFESFKKTNHKDVQRLDEQYSDQFRRNNLFHLNKIDEMERTYSERLQNVATDAEKKTRLTEQQAELRVGRLKDKSDQERQLQGQLFKDAITEAKRGYQEELRELRVKHLEEKSNIVRRMQKQMEENDNNQSVRFRRTVTDLEKQLQDTHDRQLREVRSLTRRHERQLKQQAKVSDLEKESLRLQYEEKLNQIKESHKNEVKRLNANHEAEIQELIVARQES